ncbi:hypothetical protein LCGC14_2903890, partial [marine sediment metagenome]
FFLDETLSVPLLFGALELLKQSCAVSARERWFFVVVH